MRYLIAIFLPPLAVLMTGRMGAFILNCILTLLLWVPGIVHAFIVIGAAEADKRHDKLIKAIGQQQPAR